MSAKKKPPKFMEKVLETASKCHVHQMMVEFTRPEETALAIKMRAELESLYRIRQATGISIPTLKRLFYTNKETVDELRKKAALNMSFVSETYTELALERADQLAESPDELRKMNPKDLALTAAIFQDKSDSAAGRNTVGIEHRKGASYEDAQAAIAAARSRITTGRTIDV